MNQKHLATSVDFKLNNGETIPALGLGTAYLQDRLALAKQTVKVAVKAGYRYIDTAYYYKTEGVIGEALKELFEEGVVERKDIFITTKVWPNFWNRVDESINGSLERLQLDYVDLVLQHWPFNFPYVENKETGEVIDLPKDADGNQMYSCEGDFLETYRQLEKIYLDKNDHRVRSIGVSNYAPLHIEKLLSDTTIKTVPSINQVELTPQLPQLELLECCSENGIVVIAYSPLGSSGAPVLQLPLIAELSKSLDLDPSEVIFSYLIAKKIVAIPRSVKPERITSNVHYKTLLDEIVHQIDDIGRTNPHRYVDEDFAAMLPGFTGAHKTS